MSNTETTTQPASRQVSLAKYQPQFADSLASAGLFPLRARGIQTLQINITRRCNQTCAHCHVDAGPSRKEEMSDAIIDRVQDILRSGRVRRLDITGGAPELHDRFEDLLDTAHAAGVDVLHRCNLTAIRTPPYRHLPEKFARQKVEIIASLPHFRAGQTNLQRGNGVFEKSITSLRELNELGYGREGSGRILNLVTNPTGAWLPGDQQELEKLWKKKLADGFGISFNQLFCITNMPIARFLDFLRSTDQLEAYMDSLLAAFNPVAAENVMCRDLISVGWDGTLYDCDFNQMLELPVKPNGESPPNILDTDWAALGEREIVTANHCYGCTAGAGSSCGGAVAD